MRTIEADVAAPHLDVFDRPADQGFITGRAERGDRLRVRSDAKAPSGWLAIEPLPTSILWIQESSLDLEDEAAMAVAEPSRPGTADRGRVARAWVGKRNAIVRSGHPSARLPGPQKGSLPAGTMVQLVDRPALGLGQGTDQVRWLAIVPPPEQSFYVHADGIHWPGPKTLAPAAAEIRASYDEPVHSRNAALSAGKNLPGSSSTWPPALSAEIDRLDGMFRLIVASQPITQWRFESVRAGYQNLLKQAGNPPDLEETLRMRLARVTQRKRAAKAARTIESILARSHQRDSEVATVRQKLVQLQRSQDRAYDAIGFVQPSAHMVEGHKVFALIGREGKTDAYLDIPPGLDPEPFLASRVGVRGQAHVQ